MNRDHARVNVVAGTVTLVVLGVLLAACYYAWVTHADPARCFFGDAQCSQTIATYLLALLTAGAFYATYRAVLYTKKTVETTSETLLQSEWTATYSRASYENSVAVFKADRTPILTLQRCANIDDAMLLADPGKMPGKDRRAGHPEVVFLHYYLPDADMPLTTIRPTDCVAPAEAGEKFPYDINNFDVQSLGRVPVINGYLFMKVAGRPEKPVYIGSVAPNDYVHLVIWVRSQLTGQLTIEWADVATDDSENPIRYLPPPERMIGPTIDYPRDTIVPK